MRDLKQGYDAIEERARYELGMIKQDEIFFHILDRHPVESPDQPPAGSARGSAAQALAAVSRRRRRAYNFRNAAYMDRGRCRLQEAT